MTVAISDSELESRVLERTRLYVEMETPSGDAERCRALADRLAADLAATGARVRTVDAPAAGRHVVARIDGDEPDVAHILVIGHLDTVFPAGTLARRPFRVSDGRAEGPGVFDMKASLAVIVDALAGSAADGTLRRSVEVLITCDEETGAMTSRDLIEDRARGAAFALVLEPPLPGGAAKTARKGVATYRLEVAGRAAHAGIEPERGVSALHELARQVARIAEVGDPQAGTTVNVGRMGGGTAINVVADHGWAELEVRFPTAAAAAKVDAALRALAPTIDGASLTVERTQFRPPLERTPGVVRLYRHARDLAHGLGFELGEGATGGASDGCLTAALGVPTLDGLGVPGGGAHADDEHIFVSHIPARVRLLRKLIETL